MERRRFGILQEERDVADAQAAIVQQRHRELAAGLIQDVTE